MARPFTKWYLERKVLHTKRRFWSSCCRIKVIFHQILYLLITKLCNAEKKVAITFCYLKDTALINMITNSFRVAICTVSVIISEVCEAILKYMAPQFIFEPKNKDEMRVKAGEFEAKLGVLMELTFQLNKQSKTLKTGFATVLFFKCPGSMWLQRIFHGRWVYVAWQCSWCKNFLQILH